MPRIWTLGGLSGPELLKRTLTGSWDDAVFGQAGRMAFYHFLAIFPSLLIFLSLTARFPEIGPGLKGVIAGLMENFLPAQTCSLLNGMLGEFEVRVPNGWHLLSASATAFWAAFNGTWALIVGLNVAYEVEECRSWWKMAITIAGLSLSLAAAGIIALSLVFSTGKLSARALHEPLSPALLRGLEWIAVIALLMFSFALVYRFAPNLRNPEWQWSTPGALCALLIWTGASVGLRVYFDRFNDYTRTYGHLNSVVMLMLWLYFTNSAILIGGEMNSEIEKAAAEHGKSDRSGS
jgi:membrane protein